MTDVNPDARAAVARRLKATRRWLFLVAIVAFVALGGWLLESYRLSQEVSSRRFVLHGGDGRELVTMEHDFEPELVMKDEGARFSLSVSSGILLKMSAAGVSSDATLYVMPLHSEFLLGNRESNREIMLTVGRLGAHVGVRDSDYSKKPYLPPNVGSSDSDIRPDPSPPKHD